MQIIIDTSAPGRWLQAWRKRIVGWFTRLEVAAKSEVLEVETRLSMVEAQIALLLPLLRPVVSTAAQPRPAPVPEYHPDGSLKQIILRDGTARPV